ncbi:MAG: hypothetical cobalamin synthesis protein P47K/CobW [Candidatus Xenobia bacterium]
MSSRAQEIPLTVIGGYLGAGKTTLLNHLLRHSRGRRYAVLVNDFGSLNIDAALIEADGVLRLENGCVCCSLSNGLANALHLVSERDPPPEHVLIEASGVSDPQRIACYGHVAPFLPDGVVVVADAETVREKSQDPFVGDSVQRQLKCADLLVLNKLDLVAESERAALRAWLASLAPQARLVETRFGDLPADLLGGLAASPGAFSSESESHPEYESWSFATESPLSERSLRLCLEGWPDAVLRAKGVLYLAEEPTRRYVFQRMGRRWTLTPHRAWLPQERPSSELVLIALAGQCDGGRLVQELQVQCTGREEPIHER